MPHALVLQHAPHEGPGTVATALEHAACSVEVRRLDQGGEVPASLDGIDCLVVMGGPMGVADAPAHPFLAREIALLRLAIAKDHPVIGICLGAQLIAAAAGARVYANHAPSHPDQRVFELGWAPIRFTEAARHDPATHGLSSEEPVLHWHGDTFDLPEGAVRLASTPACANQMFRLKKHLYGMQFHIEVDEGMITQWVEQETAFIEKTNGLEGPRRIREDTVRLMPRYRAAGHRLIGNLARSLLAGAVHAK